MQRESNACGNIYILFYIFKFGLDITISFYYIIEYSFIKGFAVCGTSVREMGFQCGVLVQII